MGNLSGVSHGPASVEIEETVHGARGSGWGEAGGRGGSGFGLEVLRDWRMMGVKKRKTGAH